MHVSILIPAYNEAAHITLCLEGVRTLEQSGYTLQVVVCDDASTDNTASLALDAGALVVSSPVRLGKGGALNLAADHLDAESSCIVLLDADLAATSSEAIHLINGIERGVDMTIARIPRPLGAGGMGFVMRLARDAIARAHPQGKIPQAPLSGQRAMSRECFDALKPFAPGFGVEVDLTIRALQQGFTVAEVPCNMRHRVTTHSPSGYLHRMTQYADIRRAIARLEKRERR